MMDAPLFAITPLVLAPLALVVMLVPALLSRPLAVLRRWLVLFNVTIVSLALFAARFLFRGVRRRMDATETWWTSAQAFWLTLALLAAAGALWVWQRRRVSPAGDAVRLSEQIVLGLLSLAGGWMVVYCLQEGYPVLHPLLVVWAAAWVGLVHTFYLRWHNAHQAMDTNHLATQGVMLGTAALACAVFAVIGFSTP